MISWKHLDTYGNIWKHLDDHNIYQNPRLRPSQLNFHIFQASPQRENMPMILSSNFGTLPCSSRARWLCWGWNALNRMDNPVENVAHQTSIYRNQSRDVKQVDLWTLWLESPHWFGVWASWSPEWGAHVLLRHFSNPPRDPAALCHLGCPAGRCN